MKRGLLHTLSSQQTAMQLPTCFDKAKMKNIKISFTCEWKNTDNNKCFYFLAILNATYRGFISKTETEAVGGAEYLTAHSQLLQNSKHLMWVQNSVFLSSSKSVFYGNPRASSVSSVFQCCQFRGKTLIWGIYSPIYLFHTAAHFRIEFGKGQTLILDVLQKDEISWSQISKHSFDPPLNFQLLLKSKWNRGMKCPRASPSHWR